MVYRYFEKAKINFKIMEHNINVVRLSPGETRRIKKNVVVITVAFMVHYTAVYGIGNLQSSINAEAGLGTSALAAMFMGVLLSNIFLTSVIIKWLGTKWTVCCSFITYMPFVAFQLYPRFSTLVSAGFLMGVGSGTLLCAKSTYVSVLAEAYGMITELPSSTFLLSFSGFFFMVVHMSQIWGNLFSSLVLSAANNASVTLVNETNIPQICGSNFLPSMDAAEALPTQPFEKLLTLTGIFLTCMVGSTLLIIIGMDSMKRYQFCRTASNSLSGFALLAVTMNQLADTNQQLLLVINIFIGLQQAFFFADFTASFVSCVIGTGLVGYVMMTYGLCNVAGCFITVCFPKFLSRLPLMCGALFIHGGILVMMLTWHPHAEDFYIILTIAILWGICDSIWTIQINTYYAILFRGKEEAAFSNVGLWEGVGYIISFAISSYVRTRYKIFLLLSILILGFMGYLCVEFRQRRSNQQIHEQDFTKENSTTREEQRQAELEKLKV